MATTLAQKLNNASKDFELLKKDVKINLNGGKGYSAVGANSIIGPFKTHMEENGIVVVPGIATINTEIVRTTSEEKSDADSYTKEESIEGYLVTGTQSIKLINADDKNDIIETSWAFSGLDQLDPAKALGKALTYSWKYFVRELFSLSTDDDVDKSDSEQSSKSKRRSAR